MTETAIAAEKAGEAVAAEASTADTSAPVSMDDNRPWKLVTHYHPDTDALACLWGAVRFVVKDAPYQICFVRAGESLTQEECEGYRVLHMDTGKGDCDQHEKSLKSASSFKLLAEKHGFDRDPGIVPILNLTVAADNVEKISKTSVHFVLKGLAFHYRDKDSREVDWESVCTSAFVVLDIIYSQTAHNAKNKAAFEKYGKSETLKNGLKIANVGFKPQWRDAAFESGADVVVWFGRPEGHERENHGPFYAMIQANRKYNKGGLVLDRVIAGLREAEAKARNVTIPPKVDVWAIGSNPLFGAWMMHDSHCFISCGTRSHPLGSEDEFTKLSPTVIGKTVIVKLSELAERK
jgi:hypothetical protein